MQATLRKEAAAELRRLRRQRPSSKRRTADVRIRLDRLEWAAGALGALAVLRQPGAVALPGALATLLVVRSLGHTRPCSQEPPRTNWHPPGRAQASERLSPRLLFGRGLWARPTRTSGGGRALYLAARNCSLRLLSKHFLRPLGRARLCYGV